MKTLTLISSMKINKKFKLLFYLGFLSWSSLTSLLNFSPLIADVIEPPTVTLPPNRGFISQGGPGGTHWWDNQLDLSISNQNVPSNVEIGGDSFNYNVGTIEVEGNHLPTNPYFRRETQQLSGSSSVILDFSAVVDPDADLLDWEFQAHDINILNWNLSTQQLTVDLGSNTSGEVVVTVRDLRGDLTPRSSGMTFVESVVRP